MMLFNRPKKNLAPVLDCKLSIVILENIKEPILVSSCVIFAIPSYVLESKKKNGEIK